MAKEFNLSFEQGANVEFHILVQNSSGSAIDLSTYTASATFRRHSRSSNSYSFVCNAYANGIVSLTMNAATSANIAEGRYIYDAFIENSNNNIEKIQKGILTVKPSVTR